MYLESVITNAKSTYRKRGPEIELWDAGAPT